MTRELTCIVCPIGCALTVTEENGEYKVSGNTCPRGALYGKSEVTNPTRTLTTTVRVGNREKTLVSVKSDRPIPKEMLFLAMERVNEIKATAPIRIGDVIENDLLGVCRLVATSECP